MLGPGVVDASLSAAFVGVGGITLSLKSAPGGPDVAIGRAWNEFSVPATSADIDLRVSWGDLSDWKGRGSAVFDSGGSWSLTADGTEFIYSFFSSNLGPVPYKQLSIDRELCRGEVVFHRPYFDAGEALDPLQFPLDELLVTHRLSRGGGIELHACGVVDRDGRGYLFIGQSGDGKTTTARLWAKRNGCRVLSDDRIIVRRGAGGEAQAEAGLRIFGTPWHGEGEFARNESAQLSAIFVLGRGAENRAIPLDAVQAVGALLARSFVPFADAEGMSWTLSFLDEIAAEIPCNRLEFVPDDGVVDFVRALAESSAVVPAKAGTQNPKGTRGTGFPRSRE